MAQNNKANTNKAERATFGAGCFWGVEEAFRKVEGVISTSAGYMGGTMGNPSYEDVCTGTSGHAEVVEVQYNASLVSYEDLLRVFWDNHDPTQTDRQGADIGTQYRSEIFYHNETQQSKAINSFESEQRSGKYSRPIVTAITPASTFYKAEDDHQQYLEKRGLASCSIK